MKLHSVTITEKQRLSMTPEEALEFTFWLDDALDHSWDMTKSLNKQTMTFRRKPNEKVVYLHVQSN